MDRRRIFTRHRQRQQRRQMQLALMVMAAVTTVIWASAWNYRQTAPAALVYAPPPLNMACADGCGLVR